MLLHGPCARKHRVRAVVIEAVQSVVIEAQQRNDTEKIWEAYDRGLHIENLAQDLVVAWTTPAMAENSIEELIRTQPTVAPRNTSPTVEDSRMENRTEP